MQVEIFTLCRDVKLEGDNLTIVGTFDAVTTEKFPILISYTILVSARFEIGESGSHKLEITLVDADLRIIKTEVNNLNIETGSGRSKIHMHVWKHVGLRAQKPEDLFFELKIDGKIYGRIPMYILQG